MFKLICNNTIDKKFCFEIRLNLYQELAFYYFVILLRLRSDENY